MDKKRAEDILKGCYSNFGYLSDDLKKYQEKLRIYAMSMSDMGGGDYLSYIVSQLSEETRKMLNEFVDITMALHTLGYRKEKLSSNDHNLDNQQNEKKTKN